MPRCGVQPPGALWGWGLASLALSACRTAVLEPLGPIGQAERTILVDSLAIMLTLVILTILATLAVAWWFRATNGRARYLRDWSFSGRIELVVWAIPTLVVILLGGVTWIGAHALDPGRPVASGSPPLEIEVVSMDWKWLFIYRDARVASINRLVVPAGVPLRFSLTSATVMNTFFIPQLGSMIYTMHGMVTHLNLQADAPGTMRGLSGQFSGDGFSDMHFEVRVVPNQQFIAWVTAARGAGHALDAASYGALMSPSMAVPPALYRVEDAELFRKITLNALPPGG